MHRGLELFLTVGLVTSGAIVGCGIIHIGSDGFTKRDLVSNPNFQWVEDSAGVCDIFLERDSWASRNPLVIKEDARKSVARVLDVLQEPSYPYRVSCFYVENPARMRLLINDQVNGRSFPKANLLCEVAGDSLRALGPHELFHVISWNLWAPTEQWVNEGMAVYTDNNWWGMDLYSLSRFLDRRAKLVPLDSLIHSFGRFNHLITYPESGSVLKYIYETYGLEGLRILWKQGTTAFCRSRNITVTDLEHGWKQCFATYDTTGIRYQPD